MPQELVPNTEDDFDEVPIDVDVVAATEAKSKSAKVSLKPGPSQQQTQLRNRNPWLFTLQAHAYSGSVTLSDMEAFKAANPGGTLEDFVRWYSPRDWVEDPWETIDGQTTFQVGVARTVRGWLQPERGLCFNFFSSSRTWTSRWPPVPGAAKTSGGSREGS